MGKGDVKSKKGKIWRGSFGNARPQRPVKKAIGVAEAVATEEKPKKAAAKKA